MPTRQLFGLVPHIIVKDGPKAIEFYQKALGAEEVQRTADPSGRIMHAELKIGGSPLFLSDDFPEYCGGVSRAPKPGEPTSFTLHLDVPNCDAAVDSAVTAGAHITMPPMDMFWGDRYAKITDPFGHEWSLAHPLPQPANA
jgi:PhnB protein